MDYKDLLDIFRYPVHSGLRYHICKTGLIPDMLAILDYDQKKLEMLKSWIENNCGWNKKNDRIEWTYRHSERGERSRYILHLTSNITICVEDREVQLLYDSSCDLDLLEELKSRFHELEIKPPSHSMGIIQSRMGDLAVNFCEFKSHKHDLIPYMGKEISLFYDEMLANLQSDNGNGLYLLCGKPGTGKTTFIKNVLKKTGKKALLFSPSFAEILTSPKLISLLMNHPDSILVIEDAETILMERKADNSNAVSNLLNLTDGFLSDFLNQSIICTFNTKLQEIDPALLRQGRLKGIHEFKVIDPQNIERIASLLGVEVSSGTPMTIAEICNADRHTPNPNLKKLGF